MAWPFTSVGAPNLDTGPGAGVPTGPAGTIEAGVCWLLGMQFKNTSGSTRTVTVTDGAGTLAYEAVIPAGGQDPGETPFRPLTGAKWIADGAGVVGHVWGYK